MGINLHGQVSVACLRREILRLFANKEVKKERKKIKLKRYKRRRGCRIYSGFRFAISDKLSVITIMDNVVASEVEGQNQMAANVARKAKHCSGIWLCVLATN